MDARVKPAHDSLALDSRFLGNERTKSPSLRRDHAQPFGLALRTSFAAPEPDLHAVEIEIDHRRGVERQELAQREAADHGVAEWLAQLRARAVTEGERADREHRGRRRQQGWAAAPQAGFPHP